MHTSTYQHGGPKLLQLSFSTKMHNRHGGPKLLQLIFSIKKSSMHTGVFNAAMRSDVVGARRFPQTLL